MDDIAEQLDEIERLIRDLRIALDFQQTLESNHGMVELMRWGSGRTIDVMVPPEHMYEIDREIEEIANQLRNRVAELDVHRRPYPY